MQHDKLLFKDEVYAIQGAAFEVYREMGCGFLETVYQECLEKEFRRRSIPFAAQRVLTLAYKGELLSQTYRPDFVCHEQILIELKAVKTIAPEHQAQMLNYLKATSLRLGLIINFGHFPGIEIERLAR
ncbi:MAG TPA: GxxExxY protein [Candidatus Limnocylindria bacterium]|nr:GxxExxY protein [Candidatus Limnocylindria bacterium]